MKKATLVLSRVITSEYHDMPLQDASKNPLLYGACKTSWIIINNLVLQFRLCITGRSVACIVSS